MAKATIDVFDELLKLGMPGTSEMALIVKRVPEMALRVLRHCRNRFAGPGKQVHSPAGYIVECMRNPTKFGLRCVHGAWEGADGDADGPAERAAKAAEARKAANERDRARREAEAKKVYDERRALWERLPEKARQEVKSFVMENSPLLHGQGKDTSELELQCINEASSLGRENWRRRHFGQPLLRNEWASRRV